VLGVGRAGQGRNDGGGELRACTSLLRLCAVARQLVARWMTRRLLGQPPCQSGLHVACEASRHGVSYGGEEVGCILRA
jgi:hypothetical protein